MWYKRYGSSSCFSSAMPSRNQREQEHPGACRGSRSLERSPSQELRSLHQPPRHQSLPPSPSRSQQRHSRSQSPRGRDSNRISRQELERQLRRAENRAANAEQRLQEFESMDQPCGRRDTTSNRSLAVIRRPPRASRIPMKEIRELLGVSKQEWNNYRVCCDHP
jgi:hypothetical protein